MRLCDFPILTFDTYGTLIDWETGIWDALQPLCARLIDPPTREAALAAFAQVESACQAATPDLLYADLLAAIHRTLARNWGSDPGSILHVAQSLFHDHVPAKAIGLTTVWIDRRTGRGGGATASPQKVVEPDFRFKSMAELVAQHRAERA